MGLGFGPEKSERLREFTGTFTLTEGTPVTVSDTNLTANHQILLGLETVGGTPGAYWISARTNGTSFAVTGSTGDTSVIRYTLKDIR